MTIAELAALRRIDEDLTKIDSALEVTQSDITADGRGLEGDGLFDGSVIGAARSALLKDRREAVSTKMWDIWLESLSRSQRPEQSLPGHRKVADAIRGQNEVAAADEVAEHILLVSDVAPLSDPS